VTERERLLDELRPVALATAYRMLGSVCEAEDVVREALLRVHQALDVGERIASTLRRSDRDHPAGDQRRALRARRERYVGEWLPEPIITDGHDDPARNAKRRQGDPPVPTVHTSGCAVASRRRGPLADGHGTACYSLLFTSNSYRKRSSREAANPAA
jgi:Sigma-70 region 2